MEKTNYNTIDRLAHGDALSRDEWMVLLSSLNTDEREYLRSKAQEVAVAHYGKGVFVRALLEISSYCKNNCYYCGIRAANRNAQINKVSFAMDRTKVLSPHNFCNIIQMYDMA